MHFIIWYKNFSMGCFARTIENPTLRFVPTIQVSLEKVRSA